MDHHNNRIIAKDLRTMDQQFPVPSFDNVLGPSPLEEVDVDALSLRKVEDWLAADTGVTLLRDYRRYGSNIEYLLSIKSYSASIEHMAGKIQIFRYLLFHLEKFREEKAMTPKPWMSYLNCLDN